MPASISRCHWRRLTEDEFHREFNTNVLGPLLVIRESLKYFGPNGGSVINIGSGASRMCPPGYSIYAASKSALDAITGVLAKELAARKIRVNSLNPGATLSEGTQAAGLYGAGSEFEQQTRRDDAARPHRNTSGHREDRDVPRFRRFRLADGRGRPGIRRPEMNRRV